jgi:hypothetical protein
MANEGNNEVVIECWLTRQPDHQVSISTEPPLVLEVVGGKGRDLWPRLIQGCIDALYRRNFLCPVIGTHVGVPIRRLQTRQYRITLTPVGDPIDLEPQPPDEGAAA